jgi:cystathionine beta-lyase
MNMFDFDTCIDRKGSDSAKWRKYHDKDIIPMWVADMDFKSPPEVIQALYRRVEHGVFGYGVPGQALTDAVLAYLQRAFNWHVEAKWIVWLPGLVTGLNIACRSVGDEKDAVLTTVPIYPPFLTAPKFSRRQLKTTRLKFVNGMWQMDFADFENCMDARTRLFMLCNPHNPSGRVFTEKELIQVAQICLKHKMVICSDEIHCDLVLDPHCRHIPMASLSPEIASQTITLMAPSKTYNIPGLSCSYAIIPNDALRRRFKRTMSGIVPHVNVLGMAAAQAAYAYGQPWLEELILYLRTNRDLVYQTINRIKGLKMGAVEATYLAWIDTQNFLDKNPVRWFEETGVGLSDGKDFDGPGFVRLNFGCSRKLLHQALKRICEAARGLDDAD